MDRVLTWHLASFIEGTEAQGPTYYMEKDYDPGHVRIHARIAPDGGDFKADTGFVKLIALVLPSSELP